MVEVSNPSSPATPSSAKKVRHKWRGPDSSAKNISRADTDPMASPEGSMSEPSTESPAAAEHAAPRSSTQWEFRRMPTLSGRDEMPTMSDLGVSQSFVFRHSSADGAAAEEAEAEPANAANGSNVPDRDAVADDGELTVQIEGLRQSMDSQLNTDDPEAVDAEEKPAAANHHGRTWIQLWRHGGRKVPQAACHRLRG